MESKRNQRVEANLYLTIKRNVEEIHKDYQGIMDIPLGDAELLLIGKKVAKILGFKIE